MGGGTQFLWGDRDVWLGVLKTGVDKTDCFEKVRSKELKFFNILGTYELKFGPNLSCRAKNS